MSIGGDRKTWKRRVIRMNWLHLRKKGKESKEEENNIEGEKKRIIKKKLRIRKLQKIEPLDPIEKLQRLIPLISKDEKDKDESP
jgi:hypothetical protein